MGDWPIGLSTGSFHAERFCDCIGAIREAGFSIVEVCSFPAHLDYHDRSAVERAATRLRELELEAYSFHSPFAEHIDITALDDGARQQALAEINRALEAAAILGVRHFVLHPGPERDGGPREERLQRMENAATVLNMIARRCRDLGVRLVLENMLPHLFAGHVRDLFWLLGALETPEVGICLDTGHAFLSGDLGNVAHKLSGHLWMIHASDNHGSHDDHLPPGEGNVPWRDLLAQLASSDFRGAFILELAGGPDRRTVLAGAQRARQFLRRLATEVARPSWG